jgi:PAS domain S-box-containing protein
MDQPAGAGITPLAAAIDPFAKPADDRFSRYESLRAALDLIDQGFTLIDSNLRFVAWNKSFLRLLDFPPEMGYVGAPFESFIRFNAERGEYRNDDRTDDGDDGYDDEKKQRHIDDRMRAARAFEPHEIERTRPDGTVLLVRGVPVPGHGFVTLYSDITAQRKAQAQIREHSALLETRVAERSAELRRSEARMRLITDSIPALIAYFDHEGVYRYINRGYHDWFGLDTANPGAASAMQSLGAGSNTSIRTHVARALIGHAVTYEYETALVGGRHVQARTTLIPEIGADGTVAGCFELTFDITEQKQAQAMLVQAQKMEALGQLTGGLAHDFNNILTVIIGNLAALRAAREGDPIVAEFVEPAVEAARRGADLIQGLLSFARKQPLQAQAVDVAPLIDAVGRLVRRVLPESLLFNIDAQAAALWVWIDAQQLQNTLLNLIFNARDATQAAVQIQARIGLHASARSLDAAPALALQVEPGHYVCLEVSDNGIGMDPGTLARVFEPFFTTKRSGLGTGLGMAMAYGFVKQSGGAISIRSSVGQGTSVSLWLPACEATSALALPTELAPEQAHGAQGLALLVEDDAQVRKVVRRTLLELGFVVIEAENGSEAMQILDQTPGITLLLSDVVMPGGIDGRDLAVHARDHCGVQRVVLMSGYAPQAGHSTEVPMLAKPFTKMQLVALLEGLPT